MGGEVGVKETEPSPRGDAVGAPTQGDQPSHRSCGFGSGAASARLWPSFSADRARTRDLASGLNPGLAWPVGQLGTRAPFERGAPRD